MTSVLLTCPLLLVIVATAAGLQTRQRRDDEGRIMPVSTIIEPPYLIEKGQDDSGNPEYEGFIPDLMKSLSKEIPLNYEFKVIEDGKYGSAESSGKWNGMIGAVMDSKADMAAAPMTISSQREQVIDFTSPFLTFGGTVLLLKVTDDETLPEVKEIADLASQTVVKYGVVKDGETERFFRSSSNSQYRKIYETMSNSPDDMVRTVEEGVQKVRDSDGKYAFIMEGITADYWSNKRPCNLRVVGNDSINPVSYGLVVRKASSLLGELNEGLKALREAGTIEKLRAKWWQGECSAAAGINSSLIPQVALTVIGVTLARLSAM